MHKHRGAALAAAIVVAAAQQAMAVSVLQDGGFDGTSLGPWVERHDNSPNTIMGKFCLAYGAGTPNWNRPTVGPISGGYAVCDQDEAGVRMLYQTFTVGPSDQATLSFDMFVNNWAASGTTEGGDLSWKGNDQYARVDILAGSADPFSTAGSDVVRNLYCGADTGPSPNPWTHYTFNVTDEIGQGGTFMLRFAEADTAGFLSMGVDNVNLDVSDTLVALVPEPITVLAMVGGAMAVGRYIRRRY